MTLSSSTARNSYACTGSQTVFPYTFRILDQAHIKVILRSSAGIETDLPITTHFAVSGVGEAEGGNVTTVATYADGYTLTLLRSVPPSQESDYVENDLFPAESHEQALDKLTMIVQQMIEEMKRCIKLPKSSELTGAQVEIDATASRVIGWDAYGTGLSLYNTDEVFGPGPEYFDIPANDLAARGIITRELTAGENLAFGNVVYRKSDGKFWQSDADASTTMPVVAMALETIAADGAGKMFFWGWVRNSAWTWTPGGWLYASTTPGALTQTPPSGSGDQVQAIGWAYSATIIFFNPVLILIEVL
jgi:hypothetical protein